VLERAVLHRTTASVDRPKRTFRNFRFPFVRIRGIHRVPAVLGNLGRSTAICCKSDAATASTPSPLRDFLGRGHTGRTFEHPRVAGSIPPLAPPIRPPRGLVLEVFTRVS